AAAPLRLGAHAGGQVCCDLRQGALLGGVDEGGAHDHAVGEGCDLCGLLAVADTESDGHRQVGGRPAALDELLGTLINLVLSAGDTHVGGRVDEAATGVGGHLQPLHGGGLSRQVDRIQIVFFTSDLPAA